MQQAFNYGIKTNVKQDATMIQHYTFMECVSIL